jgi:hypothetical protein
MNLEIVRQNLTGAVAAIVLVILIMLSVLGCALAPFMFASSFLAPLIGLAPETATPTLTRTPKPTFTPTATYTPTPDIRVDFRADRDQIVAGETVALQWSVEGAETVTVDGNPIEHQGMRELSPTETQTWVLRAESSAGIVERQVTVVVTQPTPTFTPVVTDTPTPTRVPPTPTRRPATPTPTRRPATPTPRGPAPTPVPQYDFRYVQGSMRIFPNCGTVYMKGKITGMGGEPVNGRIVRLRFAGNVAYKESGVGEDPGSWGFAPLAPNLYHAPFVFQIDIVQSEANPVPVSDTFNIEFHGCDAMGQMENITFEYAR